MMPKNVAPAAHSARSLSGWDRPSRADELAGAAS